jgi:hypothetical protein
MEKPAPSDPGKNKPNQTQFQPQEHLAQLAG